MNENDNGEKVLGCQKASTLPDEDYTGCHTHARDLQVLQGHAISRFQVNIGAACSSEQSLPSFSS